MLWCAVLKIDEHDHEGERFGVIFIILEIWFVHALAHVCAVLDVISCVASVIGVNILIFDVRL